VTLDVTVEDAGIDSDWDAFVQSAPGGSHVQTSLWAEVKATVGWSSLRVVARRDGAIAGGCQLLIRKTGPLTMAYAPRGPVVGPDGEDVFDAIVKCLKQVAAERRLSYLKVQPPPAAIDLGERLAARGFVASDLEAAPVATVLVDLTPEPDELLQRMRKGVRSNVRKAVRHGIEVRTGDVGEVDTFGELVHATSERQGFSPYPTEYYRRMLELFGPDDHATLLFAEHEGRVLSGLLIVGWNDTAVYKMGAWGGDPGPLHPNELGHYTAMCWARERGYRWYDLEGIPVVTAEALQRGEENDDARSGTTWFKRGFGGEVRLFPGAYDTSGSRTLAPFVRRAAPGLRRWESIALRVVGRRRGD
jgi:lipid II:glycine glycyltransferase (peptidoglycan interpeptide bridge formation enzyme)